MVTKNGEKFSCFLIYSYACNDSIANLFSRGFIELQGGYKI